MKNFELNTLLSSKQLATQAFTVKFPLGVHMQLDEWQLPSFLDYKGA